MKFANRSIDLLINFNDTLLKNGIEQYKNQLSGSRHPLWPSV
jgi:hypothetical protein